MDYHHKSVLLDECLDALAIRPGGIYVDCTLGGGGHSREIARRLTQGGLLVCIDQDQDAITHAGDVLAQFHRCVKLVKGSFFDIEQILAQIGIGKVDGFLADLGVSSHQLDEPSRGFSYMHDAPLDMRMDASASFCAHDIINGYDEERLAGLISQYGEERFAKRVASSIIKNRPIDSTAKLVDTIKQAIPAKMRESGQHPAKRTFQAIRIEVNNEITHLGRTLENMAKLLTVGGRIAVISFHSLEDRAVKTAFRKLEGGCKCPRDFPVCICDNPQVLKAVTRKPITPSAEELASNHRARSAKLRAAEKL